MSPEGVPFEARALPKSCKIGKPYYVYEVIKPLKVNSGKAAPWFNKAGMGVQYELPRSVQDLLNEGILRDVSPCRSKL